MLISKQIKLGIHEYRLDLTKLFNKNDLPEFDKRWHGFFNSDKLNTKIFKKEGETLSYLCDHFVPERSDNKTPIFMLFGNSAPHSITEECYFSYEGNRREHRMWKLFEEIGLFESSKWHNLSLEARNKIRKDTWFNLNYKSPFRLAMDVFLSIPSTPSKPPWSGVAGTQKLLGKKATKALVEWEHKRLKETLNKFLNEKGYILAFQKDAYNGIVTTNSKPYNLQDAIDGNLTGEYIFNPQIKVYGIAPTRWLNGGKAKDTLKNIIKELA